MKNTLTENNWIAGKWIIGNGYDSGLTLNWMHYTLNTSKQIDQSK